MSKTNLYRFFDAHGKLLYVGISLSVVKRMQEHLQEKHWIPDNGTVTWTSYETRNAAEEAERVAIRHERPAHNVVHNPVRPSHAYSTQPKHESAAELAGDCVREGNSISHHRLCKMSDGGTNECRFQKSILAFGFCCKRAWHAQVARFGYRLTMRHMTELMFDAEMRKDSVPVALDGLQVFEPPYACHNHKLGS